jgi:hypothetical protein
MAKLTAWLVSLIGVLLVLDLLAADLIAANIEAWLIALAVLIIGIGKIVRNYKLMK